MCENLFSGKWSRWTCCDRIVWCKQMTNQIYKGINKSGPNYFHQSNFFTSHFDADDEKRGIQNEINRPIWIVINVY